MDGRWAWAFVVACPTCAGGFFLSLGAVAGISIAVVKGALLVAALALVAALWIANAWRRRGACDVARPDRRAPQPKPAPQGKP